MTGVKAWFTPERILDLLSIVALTMYGLWLLTTLALDRMSPAE